jgi:hypothetical protein
LRWVRTEAHRTYAGYSIDDHYCDGDHCDEWCKNRQDGRLSRRQWDSYLSDLRRRHR